MPKRARDASQCRSVARRQRRHEPLAAREGKERAARGRDQDSLLRLAEETADPGELDRLVDAERRRIGWNQREPVDDGLEHARDAGASRLVEPAVQPHAHRLARDLEEDGDQVVVENARSKWSAGPPSATSGGLTRGPWPCLTVGRSRARARTSRGSGRERGRAASSGCVAPRRSRPCDARKEGLELVSRDDSSGRRGPREEPRLDRLLLVRRPGPERASSGSARSSRGKPPLVAPRWRNGARRDRPRGRSGCEDGAPTMYSGNRAFTWRSRATSSSWRMPTWVESASH